MVGVSRPAQLLLVAGFLATVYGVPLGQIGSELYRGRPVQCTDLFRYPPSVKNLRTFEHALENRWWGQSTIRPLMRRFLLSTLGDTGAKTIAGRRGWLFYRPGTRYLVQPDRPDDDANDSIWMKPTGRQTRREHVVRAIIQYATQLKQRGIRLLVVPVPGKASVYPDMLSRRMDGAASTFRSPTERLLKELQRRGVETVDLFAAFRSARAATGTPSFGKRYYLKQDTHWTPDGVSVAARAVARRLRALSWVPEHPYEYARRTVDVQRRGDLVEMMQLPGAQAVFPPETVTCSQRVDAIAGPLVPPAGGPAGTFRNEHLVDTPMEATYLLLGDSFGRIYQTTEPSSLGQVASAPAANDADLPARGRDNAIANGNRTPAHRKRLLPGSAGLPAQLAAELKAAVDYIVSDGGAATDVRRRLSVNSEMLDRKRVVIWEFAERDIGLGQQGWQHVPLPPAM